ncbi:MAG: DUF6017 domain-containing protein [Oscillospiraceae bacterium]|nr:DUF6017 domain-containing protein [Oscillospiraceae bacterium]
MSYYYSHEAEQYTFYRLPKALFTNARYKSLSDGAKILYGLMLDRMSLSIKNSWTDDKDRVFIMFTLENICEYLNCGRDKGVKMTAELEKIALIERVKRQGKPAIIYVRKFLDASLTTQKPQPKTIDTQDFDDAETQTSDEPEDNLMTTRSLDFGKAEVRTSEKPTSRLRESRLLDFGKTDPNNTNKNNTEKNDTNPIVSYPSAHTHDIGCDKTGQDTTVDEFSLMRSKIHDHIDYPGLLIQHFNQPLVDEIVELMVETVCTHRKTLCVTKTDYPTEVVRKRFLSLDNSHINFVLDRLRENMADIRNIKAYILAMLFNAPTTTNAHFTARVAHDNSLGLESVGSSP